MVIFETHEKGEFVGESGSMFIKIPFAWNLDAEGAFSVGNTRKFIDDNNMIHALTATRRSKFVPRRANILIWRLRLDRLPLRFSLSKRGCEIDTLNCPICNDGVETSIYCFRGFEVAHQVWRKISRWCDVTISVEDSIQEWYDSLVDSSRSSEMKIKFEVIIIASIWILWRFRNSMVFNNNPIRRSDIFDLIVLTSFNWLKARASKMHMSWNDWVSNHL